MTPEPIFLDRAEGRSHRLADELSTGEGWELLDLAGRKRAGPYALISRRLEDLGLVEFVRETRSGTTWWRVTEEGRLVAEVLKRRRCLVCAGRGVITRVIPRADVPCQECRREDHDAFLAAERAARRVGGPS